MKNMKKFVVGCAMVFAISATSITVFAASAYSTPAEAAAGVTGKTLEEVISERQSGKSYGTIAAEAEKLDEFHTAVLDIYSDNLNARVADGTLTQEQADAQFQTIKDQQAVCDGTGTGCNSTVCGLGGTGYGNGDGCGNGGGRGVGRGNGGGRGNGRGMGLRNGSCLYQ